MLIGLNSNCGWIPFKGTHGYIQLVFALAQRLVQYPNAFLLGIQASHLPNIWHWCQVVCQKAYNINMTLTLN